MGGPLSSEANTLRSDRLRGLGWDCKGHSDMGGREDCAAYALGGFQRVAWEKDPFCGEVGLSPRCGSWPWGRVGK